MLRMDSPECTTSKASLMRSSGRVCVIRPSMLTALRRVERNDVVALFQAGDPRADIDDDARAFVAENRREKPPRDRRPSA